MSGAAFIRAGEDQRELVAAEARDGVGLPKVGHDPVRDLADEKIAGAMPERVVYLLEPIEVHHQKRERRREPPRGPERLLEAIEKKRAVRQAGQRVVQRLPFELVLRLLAVGDVRKARDDLADVAGRVLDRNGVDEKPAHVPVRADHPHHHVADGLAARLRRDVGDLVVGHRGPVLAHPAVLTWGRHPVELVGRSAEDPLCRGVREDDGACRVADYDAARHRVVDGA